MALTQIQRAGISASAKDRISVLEYIPIAQHAAIRAGTSTYNATSNIQNAIDNGETVFFPAGKYRCDAGLTLNVGTKIIGEANEKGNANIAKGTGTIIELNGSAGITAVSKNKIEFYDVTIKTTTNFSTQYLVKFDGVYACRFHTVVIQHNGRHASATA